MSTVTYGLRIDNLDEPGPLPHTVMYPSLEAAKLAFEQTTPKSSTRAVIKVYDGDRVVGHAMVGHSREGAVVWKTEERG